MKNILLFTKKHWLTLLLLAASIVVVQWIVRTQRAPGSMTVIEAQGMDMAGVKPPLGAVPVSTAKAILRPIGSGVKLPAMAMALDEEEVVARVAGKVTKVLVYPGDRVKPGQLLATIDAPELDAEIRKAQAMYGAKASEIVSAEREIEHHRGIEAQSKAAIQEASASLRRNQADLEGARLEVQRAKEDAMSRASEIDERTAELKYADQTLVRKKALYDDGAISLDAYQSAKRDRDAAYAKLKSTESMARSAEQMIEIAAKKVESAQQSLEESQAALDVAKALAEQAKQGVAQAHADAAAVRLESSAAQADTEKAQVLASFRELRSLGSGIVAERVISPGTPVMAGQVVLKLKSTDSVRIQAEAPASMAADVRIGTNIVISGPGVSLRAKLTSVFPTIDPQTRTFRIEAIVRNSSGLLKPGEFLKVQLAGEVNSEQLAVPSDGIQGSSKEAFVWVVRTKQGTGKADWTCTMHPEVSKPGPGQCPICGMTLVLRKRGGNLIAHRQPIEIGESSDQFTAVLSGLNSGEEVITSGLDDLHEGISIQPKLTAAVNPTQPQVADQSIAAPAHRQAPARKRAEPPRHNSASTYTCPMDPEVVSSSPGKCPKCGMNLVKKTVQR